MEREKHLKFLKNSTLIILVPFIISTYSCKSYYQVDTENNPTVERLNELKTQGKYLIIHNETAAFKLSEFSFTSTSITGKLESLPKEHRLYNLTFSEKKNRYKSKEKIVLNEVHIYTTQQIGNNELLTIPISSITKIEIYNKNKNATTKSYVFGGLGIGLGLLTLLSLGALILIIAAFG